MAPPDNLFPSIGTLAQQADSSADLVDLGDNTDAPPKDDDDRVVEEIESLCMNCEEQVSTNLSTH
jgi:zinc finger protein